MGADYSRADRLDEGDLDRRRGGNGRRPGCTTHVITMGGNLEGGAVPGQPYGGGVLT
jgi:hypothetical protein